MTKNLNTHTHTSSASSEDLALAGGSSNSNLQNAKKAKNDEFYTQYPDIEKEVNAYLDFDRDVFRGKTILLPCDDPYESNFFKFFASKFNEFGLKKLIATSYAGSPIANKELTLFSALGIEDPEIVGDAKNRQKNNKQKAFVIEITEVKDLTGDGATNILDVKQFLEENPPKELKGSGKFPAGDFRSDEVCKLREEADIVITNPPFSLFREFLKWIEPENKKFLIIGNMNAITYKEVFPLIKENVVWLGPSISSGDREFEIPPHYETSSPSLKIYPDGRRTVRVPGVRWFTNLDHGRRHEPLQLMTMADNLKFSKSKKLGSEYLKYDNYDAIEVPEVKLIPSDYDGVMGVPISFLDKYNPEQFEIIGATESEGKGFSNGIWDESSKVAQATVTRSEERERVYKRIFISFRKANRTQISRTSQQPKGHKS